MRLIVNLLDLSKAEEGQLAPRPGSVPLRELVGEVIVEFSVRAEDRGVRLAQEIEVDAVYADRDLLRRLLENLVENALRHAPPGSAVRIRAQRAGESVELRVADAGAGVAPELRSQIFEKFVQLEGEGREPSQGNRGMGLTFCKMAVEAHGGTIRIEDGAPGAVFCATFPAPPR